jgi:hypothetical protein
MAFYWTDFVTNSCYNVMEELYGAHVIMYLAPVCFRSVRPHEHNCQDMQYPVVSNMMFILSQLQNYLMSCN